MPRVSLVTFLHRSTLCNSKTSPSEQRQRSILVTALLDAHVAVALVCEQCEILRDQGTGCLPILAFPTWVPRLTNRTMQCSYYRSDDRYCRSLASLLECACPNNRTLRSVKLPNQSILHHARYSTKAGAIFKLNTSS